MFCVEPSGVGESEVKRLSNAFRALYKMLKDVGWHEANVIGPDSASITQSDNLFTRYVIHKEYQLVL